MRLVNLELHGFKSFADPMRLGFPGGMTAVVGPNGCGKSNISDAIAWVLGEQRASLLRGSEMADVIFAGTSTRKTMGMAEVKLAIEMPDPENAGASKEVQISRRLYRDAGSEYRINGREARLKDVQDLLMDTGMGTRAYSFIQQGQIDLILSAKPKDRRLLLEEAAGITRYKLRRAEAERRLEDTRANLQRLDDILYEQGKQLDSLKRQAARTRKAMELDTAIKETQRVLLAGKAQEMEGAKERILEQLDTMERQIAALTAQASEKASEVESERNALDELNRAQERRNRAILGLDQRLGLMEQDKSFQEERIGESERQQASLKQRLDELENRSTDTAVELERLSKALEEAEKVLEGREGLVSDAEEAVALASGALRRIEGELKELRAKRADVQRLALEAQRQRQAVHQQIAQMEGRLEALNHDEAVRAPRMEGLNADAQRLAREEEGAAGRMEEMEEAIQVQTRLRQEAEDAFTSGNAALRDAEGLLEGEERRMREVADALKKASASEQLQESLTWLRERGEAPWMLSEALDVDEALLGDVERLMGSWLQTVALSPAGLGHLAEVPGRLGVDVGHDPEPCETPNGCEPLRAHLRWKAGMSRPLEGLLVRAFRCTDEGVPSLAASHPQLAFVSPRFVKLPFGPIQSGVEAPAASPLKLRAELEAARAKREELLSKVEDLEAGGKDRQNRFQDAVERFREMEDDRIVARRTLEDLRGRLASTRAQIAEIEEAQRRADEQWEALEREISQLRARLREMEEQPVNTEEAGLAEEIQAAEGRYQEAQSELERRREVLLEASQMRGSAWAERDSVQRQLQHLQRGTFDLESERKRIREEMDVAAERAAQSAAHIQELETEAQEALEARQRLVQELADTQPEVERAQETLRVQERNARELQQALENARQLHQEALVGAAQVQGSMDAISKEIEFALGMTVPEFLASVTDEEKEACAQGELVHQTKLSELQAKRMDLGSVNPMAIQELQEAEDRMAFMQQQRGDVTEAITNLEATIKEINATSEERFQEAFDFISLRFQEVFKEVFGGGSANLFLEDPKDVLECGIEITAQPPGKSAKALTLLSGGEKALTAISLLFAIFHFKPSPFCVLDEVDAPLDEANVGRFAQLVQRMKKDTQFLVITHQKPTMIAADSLYGVTMAEQGVSRLVSVQLREAEQLV